jgi:muconolactone D-isomerase
MEYVVEMTTHVPVGTPEEAVDATRTREAARARELASDGHLLRLWRPPLAPGEWRRFGLFSADNDDRLEEALVSMPLRVWRTDEVTPLSAHPNDPGATSARDAAELAARLESLPLYDWMSVESTPLSVHPNDPVNGTRS